ncbi:PREDICTED: Transcriptional coactivator Hfi1/Transcriptional [Prunus dulcis]|uniref:PREDICTED: Transcriptional coactivator Hfi1/Transcriptional n=1 Tax=Prunus dulcis TaxID=3755 RepID=A0A5E4FW65_PRUDU|nr:uncharacterized protein LOC117631738 [Prunus dulcis]KAI5325215.1 hypothetical protein L3X38_034289 [Prunus dulcis]VVA31662.1 PREDICTED: Transcriptional coactivator Hfi1/Transcriptional [Prunus dulcis]
MPASRQFSRIDTLELKAQIEKKIGSQKAGKYFNLVTRYLSVKISKPDFDRLCIATIGKENVCLHNHFIRSILKNACLSRTPPPKGSNIASSLSVKVPNGCQRSSLQLLCRDFPQSPRKGRTPNLRDRRLRDGFAPFRPQGKNHSGACEGPISKIQEQEKATELLSLGSRPPVSVEDGEEVDQAAESPSIHSMSPLTAPLGISINSGRTKKLLIKGSGPAIYNDTCQSSGELPDTSSLRKRLEQKLAMEGMGISEDCANLLNNGLEIFLKRLIKPCLDLAGSRSLDKHIDQGHSQASSNGMRPVRYIQRPTRPSSASILDFQVAMDLNPLLLGEDWPTKLEKVCLHAS